MAYKYVAVANDCEFPDETTPVRLDEWAPAVIGTSYWDTVANAVNEFMTCCDGADITDDSYGRVGHVIGFAVKITAYDEATMEPMCTSVQPCSISIDSVTYDFEAYGNPSYRRSITV